jgi:hypothetical protein
VEHGPWQTVDAGVEFRYYENNALPDRPSGKMVRKKAVFRKGICETNTILEGDVVKEK